MTFIERLLTPARVALLACGLAFGPSALAGEGHDHGDAVPAATGPASPRISVHSDLFELVGIVNHDTMTIYLDRYASNEPVSGAKVEVEVGTEVEAGAGAGAGTTVKKAFAVEQADGSYLFKHDVLERGGTLSISFTVTAGADTELLAGDLEIGHHDDAPAAVATSSGTRRTVGYAAAALVALIALAFTVMRLRRRPAAL